MYIKSARGFRSKFNPKSSYARHDVFTYSYARQKPIDERTFGATLKKLFGLYKTKFEEEEKDAALLSGERTGDTEERSEMEDHSEVGQCGT